MKNEWRPLGEKEVFRDGVLKIRHKDYFFERVADSMTFTVVDISDWAVCVPKTKEGDFIIVQQFRAGFEKDTLEFPGGSVNKSEAPEKGAERELTEETGAIPAKMSLLGTMEPNPAFMSNLCHVYLAEGCEFTGETKPDKFEDTRAIKVSEAKLLEMIKNGEFSQSISLAAFGLYLSSRTETKRG